jgi:uncharacterized protein (DUF2461 family)
MPEREQLLALRRWLAENHGEYSAQVKKLLKPRSSNSSRTPRAPHFEPIDPDALSRVPKGFRSEHPAADLLRARNWGVSCTLPTALALEPVLAPEIITCFRTMTPLVDMLNTAILSAAAGSEGLLRRGRANAFL